MTEEEKKAIEVLKEEIKSLEKAKIEFSNEIEDKGWLQKNINELDKDIFYKNTLLNLIEKLQKENEKLKKITTSYDAFPKYNKKNSIIIASPDFFQNGTFVKKFIPKDKIRNCINEYEKEIKTYEDKMVEITQKEKHFAIENEDYIRYSCIISNFTDKIKLLKELLEEE